MPVRVLVELLACCLVRPLFDAPCATASLDSSHLPNLARLRWEAGLLGHAPSSHSTHGTVTDNPVLVFRAQVGEVNGEVRKTARQNVGVLKVVSGGE